MAMAKRKNRIHAANLINSDRLSDVYALLRDEEWHGTREIVHACDVCAVNTIIAELRDNGLRIETRCVGQGRYEYRLAALVVKKKTTDEAA